MSLNVWTSPAAFAAQPAAVSVTASTNPVASGKLHQPDNPYVNQVRIDPLSTVPKANETNNVATEETTVKSKVDLTASISTSGLSSGTEGDMTFDVSATFAPGATDDNDVPRNFLVVAELPIGVIPLKLQGPSEVWTCQVERSPVNKVTSVGSLTTGTANASFTVHVSVISQDHPITATVQVDPDDRDRRDRRGQQHHAKFVGHRGRCGAPGRCWPSGPGRHPRAQGGWP